jgi:hypothetical protein
VIELLCTDYNKKATSIHYYFGNAVLVCQQAGTGGNRRYLCKSLSFKQEIIIQKALRGLPF